jgi:nitric oxide reductase subunit C
LLTKASTRRAFFLGTALFTAIFAGLTIHTHTTIAARMHSKALTPGVVRGLHVWGRFNCENCHTLLGEGAYFAPDLTQIVAQRGRPYLGAFLADPSRFYSEERDGRLMPTLGLTAAEIADVLDFLAWVGGIDTNGWPPRPILVSGVAARGLPGVEGEAGAADPVSRGKAIFDGAGACASCHARAGDSVLVGPSLEGVASRASQRIQAPDYHGSARDPAAYLRESVLDPSAYIVEPRYAAGAISLMPAAVGATLGAEQVEDLVAYLSRLH